MKRIRSASILVAGLALTGVLIAPAAQASVTNPADNPHKIEVEGDDGQEYTDGLDTLPGYDDFACTYIPGAWYDFERNRVYYADGQWIPWTEWGRATGYKEWLAEQDEPEPEETGGSTTPPPKTSTGTKSGTGTKTSTGTKSGTTTAASGGGADDETASPDTVAATPSPGVSPTPEVSPSLIAVPISADGPTANPSPSEEAEELAADAEAASESSSAGGIGILAGLLGVGLLGYGGYEVYRRSTRKGSV